MDAGARGAELSAILVTDTFETVRTTVRQLWAQSVRDRVEVVLVAPSAEALGLDERECEGFAGVVAVEVGEIEPLGAARAAGIRAATAPVVLIAESHCYPDALTAEALIGAHDGPWAAVGPSIRNANPGTSISRSNVVIDYGPVLQRDDSGPVEYLPTHNTSFKRDVLVDLGDRLEDLIDFPTGMSEELRERGHGLWLEASARMYHLQVSRPRAWLVERVLAGREFGAFRSAGWSWRRRALYAAGAPLIPPIRFVRLLGDLRRAGPEPWRAPRTLAALVIGLTASAFGEALGYALGAGQAVDRLHEIELHRVEYVRPPERAFDVASSAAA